MLRASTRLVLLVRTRSAAVGVSAYATVEKGFELYLQVAMARVLTCQVQVLDGSNINIDVNVSSCQYCTRGEKRGRTNAPHPFV